MKQKIIALLATLLFLGFFTPALADDAGGPTIGFEKGGILDSDYSKPFNSGWFFMPRGGNSVEEIRALFYDDILPIFKYLFLFLGIVFWAIYITYMISSVGNEERIAEQRKNLLLGIVGFTIIALAVEFGRVLTPLRNGSEIIDVPGTQGLIQKIVAFLQIAVGLTALIMIFYAAVRFIKANGDDEQINAAKSNLKWGLLGMIFVIFAEPLVTKVFYPEDKTLGEVEVGNFAVEAAGFLTFALTFLAVLALAALIISGFYFVTSFGDEERQSKAKTIIWSTLLGLLIIALSYTLVAVLVPNA